MHCFAKLYKVMSVYCYFRISMAYSAYFVNFWHILHINHIFVCYSANWWWRRNTGKSRITELVRVCPSGQTAGSKKTPLQIPSCQAAIFQAFESTHRTAPRFNASLHTSWLEVALTTGVDALRWEMILHGNAGEMGKYAVLSVLPDKIARFLYECYDT